MSGEGPIGGDQEATLRAATVACSEPAAAGSDELSTRAGPSRCSGGPLRCLS